MIAWRDVLSGVRTLASAAVYTTLIVTFGCRWRVSTVSAWRRRCRTRIGALSTG